MNRVNALNIYLGNYRKYLLIVLNVVLVIFIILEVMVWNKVSHFLTEEELAEHRIDLMKESQMKANENP